MRDGTIKQLVFSVDGKQSFEAVRTGLSYEDIQYNILLFLDVLAYLELQKKINVHMTVCPENIHDLAEFVTYWEYIGLRPTWMACDGRNGHALTSPSPLPCAQLLWSNLYVLSDGTCVPCCVDWQGEHPLGNLNDSTISEVWHGEAYAELREAHMQIRKADIPLCAACKASY